MEFLIDNHFDYNWVIIKYHELSCQEVYELSGQVAHELSSRAVQTLSGQAVHELSGHPAFSPVSAGSHGTW